jgi:hypothetical protein
MNRASPNDDYLTLVEATSPFQPKVRFTLADNLTAMSHSMRRSMISYVSSWNETRTSTPWSDRQERSTLRQTSRHSRWLA